MLRRIMAAYLVLATAAGPALCCCALPGLFTRHEAPTEAPPPCCCSRNGEGQQPPAPSGENPGKGGCPCRHGGPGPSLLGEPAGSPQPPSACPWPAPSLAATFDAGLAASGPATSSAAQPARTARDSLHIRHRLRC